MLIAGRLIMNSLNDRYKKDWRLRYGDPRGGLISSVRATFEPAALNRPRALRGNIYRLTVSCAALTCALLPWYTVRWHYGRLPTTLLETAILVTLVVFAVESWR